MSNQQTIDLNQNAAQCIQNAISYGYNTYYNICSGASTVVPWGFVDYALWTFLLTVVVGAALLVIGIVVTAARDSL